MTEQQPTVQRDKPSRGPRAAFTALVVLALSMGIIKPWEGEVRTTYFDIVGVATVCFGQTGPAAAPGKTYSAAECEAMLGDEVLAYAKKLDRCILRDVEMSPMQQAVVLSWAYNVGTGAACGSTLVRQLNAGAPYQQWCRQLLRWDKAGGKTVKGLTNRRRHEYSLCIENP